MFGRGLPILLGAVVSLLAFGPGCATHLDRLQPVRDLYFANQLETATAEIEKLQKKHRREADVLALDQAMIDLAAGHPELAEQRLRKTRDQFDKLSEKSIAEGAASLLTDDTAIAYPGEDYEQVLVRVMLALTNLMNGGEDAGAYALQVTEKLEQLRTEREKLEVDERLKSEAYQQVALGPYVRAMLAEESPLTLDDAVRARVQVAEYAPGFESAQADLQRAKHEVPIPPGHGVLYVFALVGRGPVKEQVNAEATQAALLVADRIVSAVSPRGLPPTLAPVPIPRVRTSSVGPGRLQVRIDDQPSGFTETIVNVGQMAALQQRAREPEIIGRAVARRVTKKGIIYATKEGVDAGSWSAASLALNVVGIAWEATETADLRCWGLLPDRIQVYRVALPAGQHTLNLQPADGAGTWGQPASRTITIPEGRNVYVLGQFPDGKLIGELLCSEDR